tara:strand:- start:390 stop:764 length:375 start_codon:yes stop_codon:yes gene_type:complete
LTRRVHPIGLCATVAVVPANGDRIPRPTTTRLTHGATTACDYLSKRSKKQVNKPNANRAACVHKRMWSDFIMDLLLFLTNFGCEVTPGSNASLFDFNGNGILDQSDFLQMLSNQPPTTSCPRPK